MASNKFLRSCLITIVIINIIFFIFALFLRVLYYDYIKANDLIYNIISPFELSIFAYNMLIFTKVDAAIFYKIVLTFCIMINVLFLNIILKKRYNRLMYFLYIMINILLIMPSYLMISGTIIYIFERQDYLSIIDIFTGDNLFIHIIFFLEIVFPIIYLKKITPS